MYNTCAVQDLRTHSSLDTCGAITPAWRDSVIYATWLIEMCDVTIYNKCAVQDLITYSSLVTCVPWLLRDMTHSYVQYYSVICATCLIHMCDTTQSYVRHDSFICETWLSHMCDMTWIIRMCSTTQSYVRHDSFICATRPLICARESIHMCNMTHTYNATQLLCAAQDARIDRMLDTCVPWLIHMCDMAHSYVQHDSFKCATWHIHMWDMILSNVRHDTIMCATWFLQMCNMP